MSVYPPQARADENPREDGLFSFGVPLGRVGPHEQSLLSRGSKKRADRPSCDGNWHSITFLRFEEEVPERQLAHDFGFGGNECDWPRIDAGSE